MQLWEVAIAIAKFLFLWWRYVWRPPRDLHEIPQGVAVASLYEAAIWGRFGGRRRIVLLSRLGTSYLSIFSNIQVG